MTGKVRVGIGGWTYPPWRETFYPPELPRSRELEYAAATFGAIEINATFYGRQSTKSWQTWASVVPDDFQFAVKGSRYCVSRPKLADAGEGVQAFLAQGLAELGPKLGPILWQMASRRTFDREDIARFLSILPTEVDGVPLRHALEPRHPSFRDETLYSLCRDHNVAIVFGDHEDFPTIEADTATWGYARLQRMQEDCLTGYDDSSLDGFAERAKHWQSKGKEGYVFMINGAKSRAPAAASALKQRLGIG